MALPSVKDIVDLVKTGATIEAQEKIMELRRAALDLQEENLSLRQRISDLENEIRQLSSASAEKCPKCHAPAWMLTDSKPDRIFGDLGAVMRTYTCSVCGFSESQLRD